MHYSENFDFYLKLNLILKEYFLGNCLKTFYYWKENRILKLPVILTALGEHVTRQLQASPLI